MDSVGRRRHRHDPRLIDALTAHIALYRSASSDPPNPNSSAPRSAVLRWFYALSTAHRQSVLTVLDPDFLRILLLMIARLRRHGHGFFFLLPDLPSSSTSSSLPSLCFRRSDGLLLRSAAADPAEGAIAHSLLLFASREGEDSECSLDAMTVSEGFVSDADRFVEIMDRISGGKFLRGEESGLSVPWAELSWLKEKGYFSLEAFVANRLEVALRLSWLSCSSGGKKQKGGKAAREKEKAGVAGVAANAFWRKNGAMDWWAGLDPGGRRKFFQTLVGKTAKARANEITKELNISWDVPSDSKLHGEFQLRYGPTTIWQKQEQSFMSRDSVFGLEVSNVSFSGIPQTLAKCFRSLLVVQDMSSLITLTSKNEYESVFFSTLASAGTIFDIMLRKLQQIIMAVSVKYINVELLGDIKIKTNKNRDQEKQSAGHHRGKKKSRNKKTSYSKTANTDFMSSDLSKEQGGRIDCLEDSRSGLCPTGNTLSDADNLKTEEVACTIQNDLEDHAVSSCKPKGTVGKKKRGKRGHKSKLSSSSVVGLESKTTDISTHAIEHELAETVDLDSSSAVLNLLSVSHADLSLTEPDILEEHEKMETCNLANGGHSSPDVCSSSPLSLTLKKSEEISTACDSDSTTCLSKQNGSQTTKHTFSASGPETVLVVKENEYYGSEYTTVNTSLTTAVDGSLGSTLDHTSVVQNDCSLCSGHYQSNFTQGESYDWDNISHSFSSSNLLPFASATDSLHADITQKCSRYFHQPMLPSRHQTMKSSAESGRGHILASLTLPMSFDWPLMVRSWSRPSQTGTANYDSGYDPRLFSKCFAGQRVQSGGSYTEKDGMYNGDAIDAYDIKDQPELSDDVESYWLSEEESETRVLSGGDYNQFFGGGTMYWNPSEHVGSGFSRPPSHSSDDSAWAWHEADLNRAIDDMVGVPGLPASYNINGMTSPPAPFCSSVDPLVHGHQSVGYAVPGNDVTGKVLSSSSVFDNSDGKISKTVANSIVSEGTKGDTLQYSMLRPIIVPSMSRRGSRSEFKLINDHKSPCIPSTRRENPRIKRPPSPVVLCVPRVPRPPPPSPVGESRKRGFPIVRSGSSSPRHWGLKSWYSDESSSEESRFCFEGAEVVWPSWGSKGLTASSMVQPLHGSLLTNQLITFSQLARDQEHPDVALPLQPPDLLNCPSKRTGLPMMQNLLHEEIDFFCKQVSAENLVKRPYVNWAVKRVARSLQVLWPRSRTNIFGSNATGLALPSSDVDLVVSLPPVRNLEPIKEAGILEGRNGIKETCLQHAARYLANQEWVRIDSLKTVENTAIPLIMLVAVVPHEIDLANENSPQAKSTEIDRKKSDPNLENLSWTTASNLKKDDHPDVKSIRLDISFKSPTHSGLQTSQLVRELTQQFPASVPLALVLKRFLADRSLDQAYSGGLSSYCLVLLIIRFLQHEHHVGRTNNQNLGGLLMDFLYFFGNVFDPRQMRVSIQGTGVYMNRERGLSIDPIHIDDPLCPSNNVGRNCFRIHQCIKAFSDAYSVMENELPNFSGDSAQTSSGNLKLLQKIIPSIESEGN